MGRVSDANERLVKAVAELIWTGSFGSTTIDQICTKAGVQKGSFYHFFDSKSEIAAIALQAEWDKEREQWDRIFSPSVPPLERLRSLARYSYEQQKELKRLFGRVLGCPLCSLGAEVSTQEDHLRITVQRIMQQAMLYFEGAVRDAHAAGLIHAPDAGAKARVLYAYGEGLLTQARIHDNAELLLEMEQGIFDILGVHNRAAQPG